VLPGRFGLHAVFIVAAAGALVWLLLALSMRPPEKLSSYIYRLDAGFDGDTTGLSRRLAGMAGVAEAVVVPEEGVAYLKVDRQVFDAASLP
jgi:hypothetical protein